MDGAFIFVRLEPNTGFLSETALTRSLWVFLVTGHHLVHNGSRPVGFGARDAAILETSIPGIVAARDVRAASTKQVASASGEGATAALLIREYEKTV